MTARRPGKVYLLVLEPPEQSNLITTDREWIQERIRPGASVERYGREWVIGRTEEEDGVLSGRIGFRGAEGLAEIWDDQATDFVPTAVPQGQAVPFAIDLATGRLALQTRPALKINGLTGALEALLSEGNLRWRIRSPRARMSFSDWRASVDRVTKVRLRVVKPNPTYRDTPNLEALIEQAEAEVVVLEMQADHGINTDTTFITESQEHIDRGYGEGIYRGESEGRETVYNTRLEAEETFEEFEVNLDGEVPHESLKTVLNEPLTSGDTDHDDGDDG